MPHRLRQLLLSLFIDMIYSQETPLHVYVRMSVERYLEQLDGEQPSDMYALFLPELERPLLEATLRYTRGNQSKTAQILGLNRGTLRTKMKQYGLM